MTIGHPPQSNNESPQTTTKSAPAQKRRWQRTISATWAALTVVTWLVFMIGAAQKLRRRGTVSTIQKVAPAQEYGLRGRVSAALASCGVWGGFLTGIGGGLQALYTTDIGAADRSNALWIGWPASLVWLMTFASSFLITNPVQRLATLQRVMFWMTGAGVAFLAIPWVRDDAAVDALGNLALFWIAGGALGILLEPARTLTSTPLATPHHLHFMC